MVTNDGVHWYFNQVFSDSDEDGIFSIKSQGNGVVTKPVTRGGTSLHILFLISRGLIIFPPY